MDNDGIVEEADLINALGFLHQRQVEARHTGTDAELIDVVSLSLGYYHEATDAGVRYDTAFSDALKALGDQGILVVAAAGNNATTDHSSRRDSHLPQRHVAGWRHPHADQRRSPQSGWRSLTVQQQWRLDRRNSPGAALVSTLPIVDAGQRSGVDLGTGPLNDREVGSWRATIDPDSFTGFGTWSGTSFAAPAAAGAAARRCSTFRSHSQRRPRSRRVRSCTACCRSWIFLQHQRLGGRPDH